MAKERTRLKILEREGRDEWSYSPKGDGGTGSVVGVAGSAHGGGGSPHALRRDRAGYSYSWGSDMVSGSVWSNWEATGEGLTAILNSEMDEAPTSHS